MLRDHGLAAFAGFGESNNSISSTTAMETAISRLSISSGIGFSAPIALSSLEDVPWQRRVSAYSAAAAV